MWPWTLRDPQAPFLFLPLWGVSSADKENLLHPLDRDTGEMRCASFAFLVGKLGMRSRTHLVPGLGGTMSPSSPLSRAFLYLSVSLCPMF